MEIEFAGELWWWRGPSPWHFVTVPEEEGAVLESLAAGVSYGWGMIPASARIGQTRWATSLWPREGRYVVPVKKHVRDAERLVLGDRVTVSLRVEV